MTLARLIEIARPRGFRSDGDSPFTSSLRSANHPSSRFPRTSSPRRVAYPRRAIDRLLVFPPTARRFDGPPTQEAQTTMVADLGGWIAVSGRLSDIQLPFRTWPASLHWQFATSWQFATDFDSGGAVCRSDFARARILSLRSALLRSISIASPDRERSTLEESASCELCFAFTPGFSSR